VSGELLEKPVDAADAARMLRVLSDSTALCHSGICVVHNERIARGLCTTAVTFTDLSDEMIDWWVRHGGWQGCAGAFQIEGMAQLLIRKIEGDFTSVVGLPVFELGRLLRELQYPLWDAESWAPPVSETR
jgi:septum formation protein